MKLSDAKGYYSDASRKVSDTVRQLGLAGIGIIWVFRVANQSSISLDPKLTKAAIWVIVSLGLDFFQYLVTTYIWFFYYRSKEKKNPDLDQEFLAPEEINWPNMTLFLLKSVALLIAYFAFIIPYLIWKMHS